MPRLEAQRTLWGALRAAWQWLPSGLRSTITVSFKIVVTVGAFYLLFAHQIPVRDRITVNVHGGGKVEVLSGETLTVPGRGAGKVSDARTVLIGQTAVRLPEAASVELADGRTGRLAPIASVTTFQAIREYLPNISIGTFALFCGLAAALKMVGVLASMYRWHLLLLGQGIEFPFWRHLFGTFLVGRFLGTFLPSTIGLDGYKLWDAAFYSRRGIEATAATAIEKVFGVIGIFLTFLVALPFGYHILGDHAGKIVGVTVPVAVGAIAVFLAVLFYPQVIQYFLDRVPLPGRGKIEGFISRVNRAAAAYRDKKGILVGVLGLSFAVHFTTAAMYYLTALAVGAKHAEFWAITFGSTIQIFATVISPFTIAGEGVREIVQALVLARHLGVSQSIISAALGFWAAEALTLFGVFWWWARRSGYRPPYVRVDGRELTDVAEASAAMWGGGASDDEATRRAAAEPATPASAPPPPLGLILTGLAGGAIGGALVGILEALYVLWGASGETHDTALIPYAIFGYGLLGTAMGAGTGLGLAAVAPWLAQISEWRATAGFHAGTVIFALGTVLTRFRVFRDLFHESLKVMSVKGIAVQLAVVAVAGVAALIAGGVLGRWFGRDPDGRPGRVAGVLAPALLVLSGLALVLIPRPGFPTVSREIGSTAAKEGAPNLVLIVVDTLRADALGAYGAADNPTPHIDSLANDGIVFEHSSSQASWTRPSFASLFTSLIPTTHTAREKNSLLPREGFPTVAELLAEAGYRTGAIVNNFNVAAKYGFDRGFERFTYLAPDFLFGARELSSELNLYQILRKVNESYLSSRKNVRNYYQPAEVVTDEAIRWLDANGGSGPFFLVVHYMDPHDPFFVHPWNGVAYARVSEDNPDPAKAELYHRTYLGEVRYLDGEIGRFLEALNGKGLRSPTGIVLTADHGEEFQEHGGWWHGQTLYEEVLHVPLIVKPPAGASFGGGPRDPHVVRTVDVAPTLLAWAGVPTPAGFQGVDLGREDGDRVAVADNDHEGNVLQSLRTGASKLIVANPDNPRGLAAREFYDLGADPGEQKDLLRSGEPPAEATRLGNLLSMKLEDAQKNAAASASDGGLSTTEADRLRALGYAQ
ncbi:MAG: sulfatase-like hydrolase/transferase [bacterium]